MRNFPTTSKLNHFHKLEQSKKADAAAATAQSNAGKEKEAVVAVKKKEVKACESGTSREE